MSTLFNTYTNLSLHDIMCEYSHVMFEVLRFLRVFIPGKLPNCFLYELGIGRRVNGIYFVADFF